ncbi:Cation/H+ exchanger [Elaphomyces granulatus]
MLPPQLALTDFNIVCLILGLFTTGYGLISYIIKERLYLSESLVCFLIGALLGPVLNVVKPLSLAQGSPENVQLITFYLSRLVLGVQLVIVGIQLPQRYLIREWRSLAVLLLPGLTAMWLCSSLFIWLIVPGLDILPALVIGACVSPTDPVLSSSIIKGRFANKNIPVELRQIIIAESGANDGLGYPFLFLPLFLYLYLGPLAHGDSRAEGVLTALQRWLGETWLYVVILSAVFGAAVGWITKELLRRSEDRQYVDKESFNIFPVSLALLTLGACGLINSDDILACFVAGNLFTFDDWFRIQTLEDSIQPTVDLILNMAIFMWLGAVCPWSSFTDGSIIPAHRLLLLGISVLLFRRLPAIYLLRRFIPQISNRRLAFFTGFFGPIGISAIFYCCIAADFLRPFIDEHPELGLLEAKLQVVVWYLVMSSICMAFLCH